MSVKMVTPAVKRTKKQPSFINKLRALEACEEAMDFCEQYPSLQKAWDACERSDWMLWLLEKKPPSNLRVFVNLSCDFMQRIAHLFPKESKKELDKIRRVLRAYANGKDVSLEKLRELESAAWSAARSAASAAWSAAQGAAWSAESAAWSAAQGAAWSAESAAWSAAQGAARSAARSAAWSAESAASAARSAAQGAARSAAWSASEKEEKAAQAELIRKLLPKAPRL